MKKVAKYGVWFAGRNTPVVKTATTRDEAIKKARLSRTAGSSGRVVAARRLKGRDLNDANKGRWVRSRPDGSHPAVKSTKQAASKYVSAFRSGPVSRSKPD